MRRVSTRFFIMAALAAEMCVWAHEAAATPIIAAYQELYSMNFEVLEQPGLPAGWYVTLDGYPVAQVHPNYWVYGRATHPGVIVPTEVAVGAVVPMDAPQLARIAVPPWHSGAFDKEKFRAIASSGLDNMGVLDDPFAYTPVAWKSGEAGVRIWLGDKWFRVVPSAGQNTSQALMAKHAYIVKTLNKKNALWTMSDTQELADLARAWGYLWRGHIPFASLRGYRDTSSDGPTGGGLSRETAPADTGGQWDIGGGGGGTGGGGGGWDSGGGNSGGSGGGSGGWDSGGGNSGGGNSPGSGGGGGWDK